MSQRRSVGVRESALYNYFTSKEALFDALILDHEHTRTERMSALAIDGPIDDGRALLERLAIASLEGFVDPREQRLFRLLMSDGIRLARSGRFNLYERFGRNRERMQALMGRLMAEGWLRKADPHLLSMTFTGPLMLWRQLHATGADLPMIRNPRAFARQHVEQFMLGAAAPSAPRIAATRRSRARSTASPRRVTNTRRQPS